MSSVWKEVADYEELVEKRLALKKEAIKAAKAGIDPKKQSLFAGYKPKKNLVKGINRLGLIRAMHTIGKDRLIDDPALLPALLENSLRGNLDYYTLLPRAVLVETEQHGQEVVPINPESLEEYDDEAADVYDALEAPPPPIEPETKTAEKSEDEGEGDSDGD